MSRESLEESQSVERQVWTPALARFLADQLRVVIATRLYSRQRWTKRRVAQYISGSLDIEGTLSETTIGRFLSANSPQDPNEETLRMVAEFLLLLGYVSSAQLRWAEAPPDIKAGLSLKQYFDVRDTKPNASFWESLGGHFVFQKSVSGFRIQGRLIIDYLANERLLLATEVLELFDPAKGFVPNLEAVGGKARHPGLKLTEYRKFGVVLASSDQVGFFMRGQDARFHSVMMADVLRYDDEDLRGIELDRSTRWQEKSTKDLGLPEVVRSGMDHMTIMRLIANDPHYIRVQIPEFVDGTRPIEDDVSQKEREFSGNPSAIEGMTRYELAVEAYEKASEPDDRLEVAIHFGYVELFKQALSEGADPNYAPESLGGPTMLFHFVFNGQEEWVDALLEYDGVEFGVDENGLKPSQIAYFAADRVKNVKGAEDIAEKFQRLERRLHQREIEAEDKAAGVTTLIKPGEPK